MTASTHQEPLRRINQARTATGKRPLSKMPKGSPRSYDKCPVAKGIGGVYVGWGGDAGYLSLPHGHIARAEKIAAAWNTYALSGQVACYVELPRSLRSWITRFDNFQYMELIKP